MNPTLGVLIPTFNRPGYLAKTFRDLERSKLADAALMIVDDGSTSRRTRRMVREFDLPGSPVHRSYRSRKPLAAALSSLPLGRLIDKTRYFTVHQALREGFDALLSTYPSIRLLVNVDSDVRMSPCWLRSLRRLFEQERTARGPLIVTAFNSASHPVREVHPDHVVKESIGGLNMMFDVTLYHELVRPALTLHWDWNVVAAMRERRYPLLCTRPSRLQHIGARGVFSSYLELDTAPDFRTDRA